MIEEVNYSIKILAVSLDNMSKALLSCGLEPTTF
jgi:hypothetical protein